MEPDPTGAGFKYWAFISYSHVDRAWGDWPHRALETYRPPRALKENADHEDASTFRAPKPVTKATAVPLSQRRTDRIAIQPPAISHQGR